MNRSDCDQALQSAAPFLRTAGVVISSLGTLSAAFAASAEEAPSRAAQPTAALVRDFRAEPFRWATEVSNFAPLLDKEELSRRLARLHGSLDPMRPWAGNDPLKPIKPLNYHIVVRFEAPEALDGFVDVDIPGESPFVNPENSDTIVVRDLAKDRKTYLDGLRKSAAAVAERSGFALVADASHADLLIHVDLAERRQTSVGFGFEDMPRLTRRVTWQPRAGLEADEVEAETSILGVEIDRNGVRIEDYLLPWSRVRAYYTSHNLYFEKTNKKTLDLRGGEIWIAYPKRTFWQAEIARRALDDFAWAARAGLGSNRDAVVNRFRSPHRIDLQPLYQAIWMTNNNQDLTHYGHPETSPDSRPHETLLSFATGLLQPNRDVLYELGGPMSLRGICGTKAHSEAVAGRLARAMTMFGAGIRAGAVLVSPAGDYATEFLADPDGMIADFSLTGYRGSFNQRLDDHLVQILLEVTSLPDFSVKKSNKRYYAEIFDRKREDISAAFRAIALDYANDGGGCAELNRDD
jgi:hypothetical protein